MAESIGVEEVKEEPIGVEQFEEIKEEVLARLRAADTPQLQMGVAIGYASVALAVLDEMLEPEILKKVLIKAVGHVANAE